MIVNELECDICHEDIKGDGWKYINKQHVCVSCLEKTGIKIET